MSRPKLLSVFADTIIYALNKLDYYCLYIKVLLM